MTSTSPWPSLVRIIKFYVPSTILFFVQNFWIEHNWYESFLVKELGNKNLQIPDWTDVKTSINTIGAPFLKDSRVERSLKRVVSSNHAMKSNKKHLQLLGFIPDYAFAEREQTLYFHPNNDMTVEEVARFKGIPFADSFEVCTMWKIEELSNKGLATTEVSPFKNDLQLNPHNAQTSVEVYCGIRFIKPCWASRLITIQTRSELCEVLQKWGDSATKYIRDLQPEKEPDLFRGLAAKSEKLLNRFSLPMKNMLDKRKFSWDN
jgi:hypothetical protein